MKEVGKVIFVDTKKNTATIQFDRKSACDKCGMCLMSKDKMNVELVLDNTLKANVDDMVCVTMGDSFVLSSAFIVYLIPVILIGISLLITRSYSEIIQIIGLGISIVTGFLLSYIVDKLIKNHKGYKPEIINIIEKSKEENENGKQ